jgi:hypothetical protein
MPRQQRRWIATWQTWAVAMLAACAIAHRPATAAEVVVAAALADVKPLIDDMPTAGALAAPATGQIVYVVDDAQGAVIGCDPFHPHKRWPAIPAAADAASRPVAIASIDSSTLAAIVRDKDSWTLRTHRLEPPGADAAPLAPRTSHTLGAVAKDDRPQLVVGPSRDWMVATGLTPPGPRMQIFAIRGTQPSTLATREASDQRRIVAAAATPANGLVVFEEDSSRTRATAVVSFHAGTHPRPLLVLDTGLPGIRAAAASRSSGDLWVVGGVAGSAATPEGLWRIEATLEDRKQATRAVCVARLEAPRDLVWISDRMILVCHGGGKRRISHVDPSSAAAGEKNR